MAKIAEKGLIAKKVGMTRIIGDNGVMLPVTLLQVEEQKITKILTGEQGGYNAYQVGYRKKAESKLTKADLHRLRKSSIEENFSYFTEFRIPEGSTGYEVGQELTAALFEGVASVDVTGVSKGKGFQGSIKRWGNSIGRMTHGSCYHRRPGSLGMRSTPGRVFKNKPVPGHMGSENVTVKNIRVISLDKERNLIAIKGSIPGHNNGYVEIRPTNKKKKVVGNQ